MIELKFKENGAVITKKLESIKDVIVTVAVMEITEQNLVSIVNLDNLDDDFYCDGNCDECEFIDECEDEDDFDDEDDSEDGEESELDKYFGGDPTDELDRIIADLKGE